MKKMSDVFALPVHYTDMGRMNDLLSTVDRHKHAAHAINHVDALADALESVLKTSRGTSGRIIIEIEDEQKLIAALKSYRGEK